MWALTKLQFKARIKSPDMIFPFFFPFVILLILAPSFSSNDDVIRAFGSLLAITVMQSGIFGFGFSLIDYKESVLFKRIGSTRITKFGAILSLCTFGLFLLVLTLVWQILLFVIFSGSGLFNGYKLVWTNMNGFGIFLGMILGMFASYTIGMFFVTVSKNQIEYSSYAFLYFFLSSFLGGLMLPNAGIPWVKQVGYILPNVWTGNIIVGSALGGSIFNFSSGYGSNVIIAADSVKGWEAAYYLFMPIVIPSVILFIDTKLFKFT